MLSILAKLNNLCAKSQRDNKFAWTTVGGYEICYSVKCNRYTLYTISFVTFTSRGKREF